MKFKFFLESKVVYGLSTRIDRRKEEKEAEEVFKKHNDKRTELLLSKWKDWRKDFKGWNDPPSEVTDFKSYLMLMKYWQPENISKSEPVVHLEQNEKKRREYQSEFEDLFNSIAFEACAKKKCKPLDYQNTPEEEIKDPVYKKILNLFRTKIKQRFGAAAVLKFNNIYMKELKISLKHGAMDLYSPAQAMQEAWTTINMEMGN